jgi:arylsulfatase A-like enzyme
MPGQSQAAQLSLLVALLAAILPCGAVSGQKIETSQKPNVVFILSDDQAWTDYGFMKHPFIRTPNIDRLASQGAVFTRSYVPTALCRPSLATLFTGLYAHQHKISGNDPSATLAAQNSPEYAKLREQLISKIDKLPTVPRMLGKLGYRSHQSGKWWEGSFSRGGFTHGMTRGFPEKGGRHGDDGLTIGREGLDPIFKFMDESKAEGKPFYVWYAPFLPHSPHNPPDRLLNKYKDKVASLHVAKYYAMCEWFDETVGQLVSRVEEMGLAKNTLFVYICDNGWIQQTDSEAFAPRSKQSPNEGGVRQPILLRWDGVIEPRTYDQLVSSIDVVPTILGATGCPRPEGLPGLDLLSLVRDGQPLQRDTIFGEGFAHDILDLDDPEATLLYRWVIRDKWKLILSYDGTASARNANNPRTGPQLYNLTEDPHEETNLASKNPEIVKELAARIENWWKVKQRKTIE